MTGWQVSMSRWISRSAIPLLSALVLLSVTGCATSTAQPEASSTPTRIVEAEEAAIPTPTATPVAVVPEPALHKTDTLAVALPGGYQATVDVTWFEPIPITSLERLQEICPGGDTSWFEGAVVGAARIDLAAGYPVVSGFQWPTNSALEASAGTDIRESSNVVAVLCREPVVGVDPAEDTIELPVTEGVVHATLWYLMWSERTPDHPDGELKAEYFETLSVWLSAYPKPTGDTWSTYR